MSKAWDTGLDLDSNNTSDELNKTNLPDLSELKKIFNGSGRDKTENSSDTVSDRRIESTEKQQIHAGSQQNGVSKEEVEQIRETPKGRTITLYLDQVLCDQTQNFARGGKVFSLEDPEIVDLSILIKGSGIINDPEVRPLLDPIELKEPTKYAQFYTHEITSGYCRFLALKRLEEKQANFKCFDTLDEDDVITHNAVENFGRKDPTEFDLAQLCYILHKKRGFDPKQISNRIGAKSNKVESYLLIFSRLPEELILIFKNQPVPEIRRQLTRISIIQRDTQEETHRAMMEAWNVYVSTSEKTNNNSNTNSNPKSVTANSNNNRGNNINSNSSRISILRSEQLNSREWFDPVSKTYRRITDEQREYADVLLNHLMRKYTRSPFR